MRLKAVLSQEDYDGLDPAVQSFYTQGQGGESWIAQLDDITDHPTVKGLAGTLARYREVAPDARAMKALKDKAVALEQAWGELDAEDVRARLDRLEELEAGGAPDAKAQLEQIKTTLQTAHQKVLTKKEEELKALQDNLTARERYIEDLVVDQDLDAALDEGKVIPELRKGAKAIIKLTHQPKAELVESADGKKPTYKGVIRTELGEASVKDFTAQWLTTDEGQGYVEASGNSGTGSKTGGGSGPWKTNPWKKETENLTEQVRITKTNPNLARQMAASAGAEL